MNPPDAPSPQDGIVPDPFPIINARRFLIELSILIPIVLGIQVLTLYVLYPALGISSRSPQPARTLLILALITWLMRRNGESWRSFGLTTFRPKWLLPILVLAFLAGQILFHQPIADILRSELEVPKAIPSYLAHIQGNPAALAGWIVLAWTVAAFAEEMIFRGYLLNRIGKILGGGNAAWTTAVIVQAAIFGLLHGYLGSGAVVTIGFKALFSGAFYLLCRRNLWPLILAHGIWDTLGFILVYLSGSPST